MIVDCQCLKCQRFHDKDKTGNKCDAFPKGIPKEIFSNRHIHTLPYKGDKGLLFEPKGKNK